MPNEEDTSFYPWKQHYTSTKIGNLYTHDKTGFLVEDTPVIKLRKESLFVAS